MNPRADFFARPRAGLGLWVLLLVIPTSSCHLIGNTDSFGAGESTDRVLYQGAILLEGGEMSAALEIIREGRSGARGILQASSGLLADGDGEVRGQSLRLVLVYGGDCPGRMTLEGEWDREAGTYQGRVRGSDCTGRADGTFRFSG